MRFFSENNRIRSLLILLSDNLYCWWFQGGCDSRRRWNWRWKLMSSAFIIINWDFLPFLGFQFFNSHGDLTLLSSEINEWFVRFWRVAESSLKDYFLASDNCLSLNLIKSVSQWVILIFCRYSCHYIEIIVMRNQIKVTKDVERESMRINSRCCLKVTNFQSWSSIWVDWKFPIFFFDRTMLNLSTRH